MTRELFISSIEALEKQMKYDIELSERLGKVYENAFEANLMYNNEILSEALLNILKEEMNDKEKDKYGYGWINWFCYETNFGKENFRIKAYDKNKEEIKMENAGDLYDFLVKENNLK